MDLCWDWVLTVLFHLCWGTKHDDCDDVMIWGFPKFVVIMFMTWINYSSIDTLYRFYLLRNIKLLFVNAHRTDSNSFSIIVSAATTKIIPLWINLEDDSRRYLNGSELSNSVLNGRGTWAKPFGFYQTTLVVVPGQISETNKLTSLTQLCFLSKGIHLAMTIILVRNRILNNCEPKFFAGCSIPRLPFAGDRGEGKRNICCVVLVAKLWRSNIR